MAHRGEAVREYLRTPGKCTSHFLRYINSSSTDEADSNWTLLEEVWRSGALEYTIRGLLGPY